MAQITGVKAVLTANAHFEPVLGLHQPLGGIGSRFLRYNAPPVVRTRQAHIRPRL